MNYLSQPVEKAIEILLDVSIRQVGYIINFKENVNELNGRLDDLERERKTVEHQVVDAKNNLGDIDENVDGWLKKVDEKITEAIEFQNDEGHKKTGCSRGLLPFLWYRHQLGRKAKKMAVAVKSTLDDKRKFDGGVSHPQNPSCVVQATSSDAGYEEFASRKETMEKIMAKLEDPTVKMIGVLGPGGVGKTTFVNAIAQKAQARNLFDRVVTVAVTENPNPQKIQEEIAYVLGLTFGGGGETGRADRLGRRLKQGTENTLLILDDLWNGLDLNKLGIPFGDDSEDDDLGYLTAKGEKDFESKEGKGEKGFGYQKVKKEKSPADDDKGCKILLTSRFREVLSDKMNVQSDLILPLGGLDEGEAVKLFKKVAEIQDENSKFKTEIVNKYCAGLPVAIVTVGRALRNKSESVWEQALKRLKEEELVGVQNSMEISVKMSYDHLESEELKSIFLLCARMGHQPLIMDLVKYSFGLGILKGVHTLRDARDRISTSIQKLKDSSLMLHGNSNDHFDMHDMVREAALSIARKHQKVFTLRNDKLDDWPDKDELERCTAISVHDSDVDELPKVINCPQLKVFHIDSDDPFLKIPGSFFEGMEKLKVLILTGFHLPCLPSSINCLLNLRMLCLERCVLRGNLSIIGTLKKLRILSFSGSEIENLPAELGCLTKLQLLDISDCSIEKVISPDFISSLTSLEELYIRKSLIKKELEGEANKILITILAELRHLHQLTFLDIWIPSAAILPRSLFFYKLTDYKIVVGDFKILSIGDFKMPNKYEASRSLALLLKDGTDIHSQKGIKMLFKTVENLLLGEISGVQNAFYELNLNGFPNLKHFSVLNNQDIEYIINSVDWSHPQDVFPNLEDLSLYNLRNMKMICRTPVTDASFNKLKAIKVKMCTQLKNLFSFYLVKLLTSLEKIDVSECDSLEEIVIDERQVNTGIVGLRKLRSLTLEVLPSFNSFYTNGKMLYLPQLIEGQATNADHIEITFADDEHSDMASLSLFGELVEIPNLESLKLSSMNNIHKIWSDQPSSSFCFQNLITLTVTDCHKLRYLCSLSVASCLKNLKGLFISECRVMEKIFSTEGNSVDYSKVCVFPKLEEILLTDMNMLMDIWQAKVGADSFSSLVSVHIEGCRKLDKVFPSHMAGRLGSLDRLKVVDCKSVQVIFELKDSPQVDKFGIDTKLRLIFLSMLPNLKQVWNRDPGGILNFKNLRSIKVSSCGKLRYTLPASVAKDLEKLEQFFVMSCREMEEIVASEEGSETSNKPLVFPEVTYMKFVSLRKIKRFYMGRHTIECPKLKRLAVRDCMKLETFTIEATNEGQPLFSAEKVISNLESMEIGFEEVKWLRSNIGKYGMNRLKELRLWSLRSIEVLYWFLHRIPNLERLDLSFVDPGIQELVPSGDIAPQERLGTVLHLKLLTLYRSSIKEIGFERDPVLQTVEHFVLINCRNLINLAHSSVSFTHLTYLEVRSCEGLISLMASSTAKSLVHLTTMKVINCKLMKDIVTNEGNEEDTVVDVVLSKLTTLELVRLINLTSFCSYENCDFKFPSLEKLIVRDCPVMRTFTESHHTRAPKLQNILAFESEEEERWHWEGDLNATIQKVFRDKVSFEYTERLELSCNYPALEQLWFGNNLVQENCFRNLKTLVVKNVEYLVHVIPSHLLPCFKNLENLEVQSCSAVQVIFNINDLRVTKALGTFRLKNLYLTDLPKLEHVWDKDPEGILGLQVLQHMRVDGCNKLKNLFPASLAKDLARLENLRVTKCMDLVEIFPKDEIAPEGATEEFAFHCLTSLVLRELPGLKYFYPGLHKLEWPVLEELNVYHCDLAILKCQEAHSEEQLVISIKVIRRIPSLKKLSFGIGNTEFSWDRVSQKLEFKFLQSFQEESDSDLYRFLRMVPNIEKLGVSYSSFKEMFSANADYSGVLSHLKELKLYFLRDLKSIGLEHSWIHPIAENLQTLEVEGCGGLINLVPCMVSFSNLTYLTVSRCESLLYLFTSSTAKSLAGLKRMKIRRCRSMQEIVRKERDESHQDEKIIFGQLQDLYLEELPKLRCFYPGNLTLCFPSLEQVSLIKCHCMETFCSVSIINPTKLSPGVRFIEGKDETPRCRCEGDLNTIMRKTREEQIGEFTCALQDLLFNRHPELQDIWHGLMPVPKLCFSNLNSLIVDRCEFLSGVVLPSHLLPFLTKLERLEVRNCITVKNLFDVKSLECIEEDRKMKNMGPVLPLSFSLKKLILVNLPNLENIWNEDPDEILRIQSLEEVFVDACKFLTSLFPASVAKDLVKLENLAVKDCEGLMAVVAEDEAAPKGTNIEFMFPCLTSLTLSDLPKLEFLYFSQHGLKVKIFTRQEPRIEDEVGIEKVIPNLEHLSLGEKELKTVFRAQFQGNHLHKIKILGLLGFDIESDELPFGFLQKAANMEKLVVKSSSFIEIFCSERPNVDYTSGFLSQLKGLELASLSELISIGLEHSWVEESFLQSLETLGVTSCSCLRNLVASPVCFSNLMHLTVTDCRELKYLFTSSTAKSLARLEQMDLSCCESMQEIVSKEENESHHDEIMFGQLQVLKLENLRNLRSFYQGSFTLSFPSLEQLLLLNCNRMEAFCPGNINANKLSAVKFKTDRNAIPLEVDLNSTIRKKFQLEVARFSQKVKHLKLDDNTNLLEIWYGLFPAPGGCFSKLKTLIVEGCQFLTNVIIPSHILGLFSYLENLEVRQCQSVKAIFEVKRISKDANNFKTGPVFSFFLTKLILQQLPNLKDVWDSDAREVIGFRNLQEVCVHGCDSLESVFPASVAESLVNLEKLDVQDCVGLVEIVAKDKAAGEGASKEFVSACMTSIRLRNLPELKCFYPGLHKLEWPRLKQVDLFHCDKLKTFTCEPQSFQEAQSESQVGIPFDRQALFTAEKVIPYLEDLALNKEDTMMICHGQFDANLLHKLQALHLQCFHNVSDTFPYGLLQKVPNIEKLFVDCSCFEEIFCSEIPTADCTAEILSHLKSLTLHSLSELKSIGLEHSWLDNISENLETLQLFQCHCLRNIVPSTISFSILIDLEVSQCRGLVYLFTSSTGRSLHQLKNMAVQDCESLQEIVFEESHDEGEIIFEQLNTLSLHSLPRLARFYNGSCTLSLPSLEIMSVIHCRGMEAFCPGTVMANKLSEVKFEDNADATPLDVDLNSSIRKAFEATAEPDRKRAESGSMA